MRWSLATGCTGNNRQEAREAGVQENDILCSEVGSQNRQQKVVADLIPGQRVMAEEMQKQQKVLMTHIDQQREVLNRQQDTLNLSLNLNCAAGTTEGCYPCGRTGSEKTSR